MTAVQVTAVIIFLLVLATYVIQAALIALAVGVVVVLGVVALLVKVVPALIVFTVWLIVLPFAPKRAMAFMRGAIEESRRAELKPRTPAGQPDGAEADLMVIQQRATEYLAQRCAESGGAGYAPAPHWDYGLRPVQRPGDEEFRQRMMAQVWALRRERFQPSAPPGGMDAAQQRVADYLTQVRSEAAASLRPGECSVRPTS